jgi:hypothetical protein
MTEQLLERLLADNPSSLTTPDFRFVNYSYPPQDLNCPHLSQNFTSWESVPKLTEDALAAFQRLTRA